MAELDRGFTQLEQAPHQDSPLATEGADDSVPNRLMAQTELVVAVFLTGAAAGLVLFMPELIGSGGIETGRDFLTFTPAFFPRLTMGLLALVSLRYVAEAWRTHADSTGNHTAEELERLKRAGFMIVIAVFYAGFITWMGFILSTMLVTLVVSYFLGLRNPLAFLPGVIAVPIVIRLFFERWLYIALPRSEIEFVAAIEDAVILFLVTVIKFLAGILG